MNLDGDTWDALGFTRVEPFDLAWLLRQRIEAANRRSKRALSRMTPDERRERQRRWQADCRRRRYLKAIVAQTEIAW